MKNEYLTQEQWNNRINQHNYLIKNRVEFIKNKSKVLFGLGITSLVIAIIPNGLGFIFYPLAFYLIAKSNIDNKLINKIKRYFKR